MDTLSQTAFARLIGTTRQAVSQAAKEGGPLADARVGTRIDPEHPAARKYAKRFTSSPKERGRGRAKKKETAPVPVATSSGRVSPEELDEIGGLTIRELLERHGTDAAFREWLQSAKLLEEKTGKRGIPYFVLDGERWERAYIPKQGFDRAGMTELLGLG